MLPFIFQGAVGRKIVLKVYVDITSATILRIKYTKPDGTRGYFDAIENTPTSMSYTTVSKSDLDVLGTWILQAYVVTPTWSDHGNIARLFVKIPE